MFTYVRIERFKCFEDVTITFGKLTLFAGINGAGKSSAIQALLLLRQAFVQGHLTKHELPLNGEMVRIGTAHDAFFSEGLHDSIALTTAFSEYPEIQYIWTFEVERQHPDEYILKGNSSQQDIPRIGLFAPQFAYFMAERLGPRLTYPIPDMPDSHLHSGFHGEYTVYDLHKYGDQPISIPSLALQDEAGNFSLRLNRQVELWMRELVPGITFRIEPLAQTDAVKIGMRLHTSEFLRPVNMGLGVTYTLPIVTAALLAEPGSMLIIENPEAHLHPAAQSRLARFLCKVAAAGVQVVVETHSDHILNGVRVAVKHKAIPPNDVAIRFFTYDDQQQRHYVEKPRLYADGGIDYWPKGFFDQFEMDLQELM